MRNCTKVSPLVLRQFITCHYVNAYLQHIHNLSPLLVSTQPAVSSWFPVFLTWARLAHHPDDKGSQLLWNACQYVLHTETYHNTAIFKKSCQDFCTTAHYNILCTVVIYLCYALWWVHWRHRSVFHLWDKPIRIKL